MPGIVNVLVQKKIKTYPENVQKLIMEALKLSEHNQATAIAEQLEGYVRKLLKEKQGD